MATWLGDLLGMEVLESRYGLGRVRMTLKAEHVNRLGITHGGVIFSLADEAFAMSCNTEEIQTVACDINLHFYRPTRPGDVLTASSTVINQGKTLGTYRLEVHDAEGRLVASGMGLGYRLSRKYDPPAD